MGTDSTPDARRLLAAIAGLIEARRNNPQCASDLDEIISRYVARLHNLEGGQTDEPMAPERRS